MKKVLIVEDDRSQQFLISHYMKKSFIDCEIITANNGVEGLQKIEYETPDLVLLDISMPILNGLEMLEQLRCKYLSKIPVIALTALSDQTTILKMVSLGIVDYLVKPITPYMVLDKIGKVLNAAYSAG
jgi:two-component system cell cycle response regulator